MFPVAGLSLKRVMWIFSLNVPQNHHKLLKLGVLKCSFPLNTPSWVLMTSEINKNNNVVNLAVKTQMQTLLETISIIFYF